MTQFFWVIFFCLISVTVHTQDRQLIDSLEILLKTTTTDTTRANLLYAISKASWGNDPVKALDHAHQSLSLSEQIGYQKGIGNAYISLGAIADDKGNYREALDTYAKALALFKGIGYDKGIATAYNNIGVVYDVRGNYPEALKNIFASLKIKEKIGDSSGMANSYNNIGLIHKKQRNYPEALKNYQIALRIREEFNNKKGIADSYINLGVIHSEQGHYQDALENFFKALPMKEEAGDKDGIAFTYSSIADIYSKQGRYPEALEKYVTALQMIEPLEDKAGIAYLHTSIGKIYSRQHQWKDAERFLRKGLVLSQQIGLPDNIKESFSGLSELDSLRGDYKSSLDHYKHFISYRDSLVNKENTKKTVELQMQYHFDAQQMADSLKFAQEKEVGALLLQRQKAITLTGFAGVAVTLLILYLVYRNYQKQRLANRQLKEAQDQLIRSEKMAAFGLMASRVSHEILNPLNFVNNFSELSQDIVRDVIVSGSEEERKENGDLLITNLKKIHEHGRRASGIIKQLQEHSSKGSAHEFFEADQGTGNNG